MTVLRVLLGFSLSLLQVGQTEGSDMATELEYYSLADNKTVIRGGNDSTYSWQYGEYNHCSVTCGIGEGIL